MSVLEQLLSTIAPHACLGCTAEGALLCAKCVQALPLVPSRCYQCGRSTTNYQTCLDCQPTSPLAGVWVVTPYAGPAKALLHVIKFERARAGARDVARAMVRLLPNGPYTITHAPTATSRIRARGYDQAELIAKELARATGQPHRALLGRTTQQRQLGQSRVSRKQQMEDAFRPLCPAPQGTILVIDDVLTTGATLDSAATTLRLNGAQHVCAAVFACA